MLTTQPLPSITPPTTALQEQYDAGLRRAQTALTTLTAQAEADERRLLAITKNLEQRLASCEKIEKELLQERTRTSDQSQELVLEVLTVQSQVAAATSQALEAERAWLIKRRILHDVQIDNERLRVQRFEQILDSLTQALGKALQQEQDVLQGTETLLTQEIEPATDPAEALRLTWQQERIAARQTTADYQEQRRRLSEALRLQEQRNLQEPQAEEGLNTLIDKYTDSSVVARRFALEFARLSRQRVPYRTAPAPALEERLRTLTDTMLFLDERIYTFDEQMEARLDALTQALQEQPLQQQETVVQEARQELTALKADLREQQQELTDLLQEISRLASLRREYRRLLDDAYHFVLTNMFWLRNVEPLDRSTFADLLRGLRTTGQRLSAFVKTEHTKLRQLFRTEPSLWLLLLVGVPGILCGAFLAYRRLGIMGAQVEASLPRHTLFSHLASGVLLVLRGGLWPGVLALIVWWHRMFVARSAELADLGPALMRGLLESALVLWVVLVGHAMLRQHGWLQRGWDLSADSCRFLWRLMMLSGLVVWGLLLPQQLLLRAPGDGPTVAGSVALSRELFLALQVALLFFWSGWPGADVAPSCSVYCRVALRNTPC